SPLSADFDPASGFTSACNPSANTSPPEYPCSVLPLPSKLSDRPMPPSPSEASTSGRHGGRPLVGGLAVVVVVMGLSGVAWASLAPSAVAVGSSFCTGSGGGSASATLVPFLGFLSSGFSLSPLAGGSAG